MPLLKRRHRSWRGFADTLPLASRDYERPKKKMKSHSQSSPMAKSILAVGALALLFAFPLLKKVSDTSIGKTLFVSSGIHTTSSYDAVIVGAGWAGIKAAETLLKGGVNNILVLEAHDYIGGRSKSVNLDNSINNPSMHGNFTNIPIDLGSEWLNQDTILSRTLINGGHLKGIDTDRVAHFIPFFDSSFYLQTFVEEKDAPATTMKTEQMEDDIVKDLFDRVWGGFEEYTEGLKKKGDGDESYWSAAKKYKEEKLTSSDVDAQFIDLAMAATEVDYTGGSNELSAFGDTISDDNDAMHYMSVPGVGYGNTAANFAANERVADRVHLNSKVTEIDYRHNPNGAIITFTKNGVESKVMAKTVLVTVSVGVLKAGNIKFTPSLPDWKQEVIDGIGFGLLNKCVMQWNDPDAAVWPVNTKEWFELITPKGQDSGKWTSFFNPTSYKGVPMLVGWAAAENARYMETQTDEEVLADVMTKLKAMFPTITTPDRYIISRWGSDENVLGTYSFKKVGRDSFSDDAEQLRKPVKNVWFAGEATFSGWYGTVNGAYASGERAAEEMLELLSAIAVVY